MFPRRYFGARYYSPRYFGEGATVVLTGILQMVTLQRIGN